MTGCVIFDPMKKVTAKESISNAVVKLFRKVNREHNRRLRDLDLTAEQAHVLTILWRNGEMTIGQLQEALSLSSGTIAGVVDRMAKRKLLERTKSEKDKRVFFIKAAPLHRRKQAQIEAALMETEELLFNEFKGTDRKSLLELLTRAFEQ